MNRFALALICAFSVTSLFALNFRNLTDDAHLSGPRLTAKELEGRILVVEIWGYQCPPCLASLPHMAKLAQKYKDDERVAIIGGHAQGRNEDGILKVLQKNKCEYSVYQFFGIQGEPSSRGIPFAYIVNHKGEFVWQGNPYSQIEALEKALEETLSKLPKLPKGSLLFGVDIEHCKDAANRIVAGQNIETILRQLQGRAGRGGPAAAEAKAIIERCEAWAEETEAAIRENMESFPSKALADAQIYARTMPRRSAELKKELIPLSKNSTVAKLANSRVTFAKLSQTKAETKSAKKQLLSKANMQIRQLDILTIEKTDKDYLDVKGLWDDFAKTLESTID